MNTKKTFITSAICIALATPAFATGIGASAQTADCDNGVLGTYTGPAALSANWTANTIKLDFYDGDDKISSGTCTYDGGIELPNDPEKTGYEFSGWKVRRAAAAPVQCSLVSMDTSVGSTNAYGTPYDEIPDSGPVGEWEMVFSYGTVKGIAMMSSVYAEPGQTGDPYSGSTSSSSDYCWCKATEFTPTNSSTCNLPSDMPWVFARDFDDLDLDPDYCPEYCTLLLNDRYYGRNYRKAIFGQSN